MDGGVAGSKNVRSVEHHVTAGLSLHVDMGTLAIPAQELRDCSRLSPVLPDAAAVRHLARPAQELRDCSHLSPMLPDAAAVRHLARLLAHTLRI